MRFDDSAAADVTWRKRFLVRGWVMESPSVRRCCWWRRSRFICTAPPPAEPLIGTCAGGARDIFTTTKGHNELWCPVQSRRTQTVQVAAWLKLRTSAEVLCWLARQMLRQHHVSCQPATHQTQVHSAFLWLSLSFGKWLSQWQSSAC